MSLIWDQGTVHFFFFFFRWRFISSKDKLEEGVQKSGVVLHHVPNAMWLFFLCTQHTLKLYKHGTLGAGHKYFMFTRGMIWSFCSIYIFVGCLLLRVLELGLALVIVLPCRIVIETWMILCDAMARFLEIQWIASILITVTHMLFTLKEKGGGKVRVNQA